MSDPILCLVRIRHTREELDRREAANPEMMKVIIETASKYVQRHRRVYSDDMVMEVDEYACEADYEAFCKEAAPELVLYDAMLDSPVEPTIYQMVPGHVLP